MRNDPPVDFEAEARRPNKPAGGAPMQISAKALMQNFVYAGLILPDNMIEEVAGKNGHTARRLKGPKTGTHFIGIVEGVIQWVDSEDC